jgi:tetratricopeptide (TPR) repeat protein
MKSLTNIAVICGRQGRHAEAIEAGKEALAIARRLGDRTGLANTCSELGDTYQAAGQPENAMSAYQESLKIFREQGARDPAGEARALGNIGAANTALGRYVEGLYLLKDALAKRREIGDKLEIIRSLSDIGDNERLQGGYEDALKYYTEGLSLARENDNRKHVIFFLVSLSNIHEDQGEYGAALSLLEEADKLARETKDDALRATSLTSMGSVLCELGDLAGAEAKLKEAAAAAEHRRHSFARRRPASRPRRSRRGSATAARRRRIAQARREPAPLPARSTQARSRAREGPAACLGKRRNRGIGSIAGCPALARVPFAAGQYVDAVREADPAITTATRLGQRDIPGPPSGGLPEAGESSGLRGSFQRRARAPRRTASRTPG